MFWAFDCEDCYQEYMTRGFGMQLKSYDAVDIMGAQKYNITCKKRTLVYRAR